jgi:genome maintenance exonuclease 1
MKHNPKFTYPKSTRSLVEGERHYDLGEAKLPSVTTILSVTQPPEKAKALTEWKLRVGANEATRIVDNSATRGTAMHRIIESYLTGQYHLDLTDVGRNAHNMAQTIIKNGLDNKITEYYGIEATLFYPDLYAGTTDLIAQHLGYDSIIDFKQTNKPKKREWIEDYFIQIAAYAMAHDHVYGTTIKKCIVMMCDPNNVYQEFVIRDHEIKNYKHRFLRRLDEYYSKQSKNEFIDKLDKMETMKGYN